MGLEGRRRAYAAATGPAGVTPMPYCPALLLTSIAVRFCLSRAKPLFPLHQQQGLTA
ncbi:protein of unknown function (plasmid) [Denitratisoma oestradiolicum]|uniref:Uncharacterized protein n=1 Tax=Denitratisoma oestradiolicum TaxID=311182 RepID=A0A6S6Y1C2_9PROT|nr:protein of unknown function [Denitratisoma oestradiolicum]CAB1371265.1 protein of unknown function [Denitratisoma oestradiolicum]